MKTGKTESGDSLRLWLSVGGLTLVLVVMLQWLSAAA
ncbi:hypothetical protein QO010_004774 [Caulobacter ginsengisoli]|uniref:Uncharacterized protein n=1 Tax=Caulobacter ginsengisoli TaxID=400775 RepID=A0ABU0IY90_9CAUL|nr:hypothetical protein [Caulobacter ginsengisoli]